MFTSSSCETFSLFPSEFLNDCWVIRVAPAVDFTVLWLICLERQLCRRQQFVAGMNWLIPCQFHLVWHFLVLQWWCGIFTLDLIEPMKCQNWIDGGRSDDWLCKLNSVSFAAYTVHEKVSWWLLKSSTIASESNSITTWLWNVILCNFIKLIFSTSYTLLRKFH